jgi:hydroxyacylglutathione hydrolase
MTHVHKHLGACYAKNAQPVAEPKTVEISEGIHLVAGAGLTHPYDANGLLVIGGKQRVLIDPGSVEGLPNLEKNLNSLGVKLSEITMIIATHGHWDHLSSAKKIKELSGARLYVHKHDQKAVEKGDRDLTASFLYDREFDAVHVDHGLKDGQKFKVGEIELRAIHTPGHTPGSVTIEIVEPNGKKMLFTGDTVAGGLSKKINSQPDAWPKSLKRLIATEADTFVMGHGPERAIKDVKGHLEEALDQYESTYWNPWFKGPARAYKY